MSLFDDLPSDSVLYRHARTERERQLGLPPTDAVLKRHYAQWLGLGRTVPATVAATATVKAAPQVAAQVARSAAAPVVATAAAAPARVAAVTAPAVRAAAAAVPPMAAPSGGLFGWLKRLFGG